MGALGAAAGVRVGVAALALVGLVALALMLAGCADEQRLRELNTVEWRMVREVYGG